MKARESGWRIDVASTGREAGRRAAAHGERLIREALERQRRAVVVLATGASQFDMLEALAAAPGLDWERVTFFHLDEYIGLPVRHPASFRRYLWERFHSKLPAPPRAFHYLDGDACDPAAECARVGALIAAESVDVAFIGIGENAHLAFNDPPADFEAAAPYLLVALDEACRAQQAGEGWFATTEDVPRHAISMSIRQILKSRHLVVTVPDKRKAVAVRDSLEGPLTPLVPASVLREHRSCTLFLDEGSASLLSGFEP